MKTRHILVLLLLGILAFYPHRVLAAGTNKLWFPVGEQLEYRMYWKFLPVATTTMTSEWVKHEGRDVIALRLTTRSGRVISKIYPIDDLVESIVDPATFLPLKYVEKLKEGKYRRDETTFFDHAAGTADWHSDHNGKKSTYKIDEDTRDTLCFTYFMRSKGLAVGKTEKFRVAAEEKIFDLIVTGVKEEKVYLSKFGKRKCLRVSTKAKFGQVFVNGGALDLWFSTDARRVCAKMAMKLPAAKINGLLRAVRGPGDDFWTKQTKKK